MPEILITPDALAAWRAADPRVRILDVRWRLDRPDGRPDFRAGHIPGAVFVDLDTELSEIGAPGEGRHPLPSIARLQAAARRWGLDDGDPVVVYDDLGSRSAARAWWVLVDAGIADVRILDGALGGWVAARLPLETGDAAPSPGDISLSSGHLPRLTIDEAASLPANGVLIDVRAEDRYRGETEPVDPQAGHIPGAVNRPSPLNSDTDGAFLSPVALRDAFAELGVTADTAVGVYCGSGVVASHSFVALTLAGFAPRLFAGSWSQWSNTDGRPVALGAQPG